MHVVETLAAAMPLPARSDAAFAPTLTLAEPSALQVTESVQTLPEPDKPFAERFESVMSSRVKPSAASLNVNVATEEPFSGSATPVIVSVGDVLSKRYVSSLAPRDATSASGSPSSASIF